MGSRGNSSTVSTNSLVGKSVADLPNSYKSIKEAFKDTDLTNQQLSTLTSLFRDIAYYDRGHDKAKTPYLITHIDIDQSLRKGSEDGLLKPDKTAIISISTEPDTDNYFVRMMDDMYRHAILGTRGGLYTYENGKKIRIDPGKFAIGIGTGVRKGSD